MVGKSPVLVEADVWQVFFHHNLETGTLYLMATLGQILGTLAQACLQKQPVFS